MHIVLYLSVFCFSITLSDRFVSVHTDQTPSQNLIPPNSKCEALTIPFCKKMGYNFTIFPNLLNHTSQIEAGLEVQQFFPLAEVNCSSELRFFLCTMYAPICTILDWPVPPCRSLCELVRNGCLALLQSYGFDWPTQLSCDNMPEDGLCIAQRSSNLAGNMSTFKK